MDRWQFKGTHNVTHQEENAEVVGLSQTFYALMDVFGVETMVPQAGKHAEEKSILSSPSQDNDDKGKGKNLRKRTPVVLPT